MGKCILSGCPAWAGPIYFPAVTIYSKWMCKKSEATSQAKICACKIWWLPARHEISGSLKRQANKSQCLFILVYAGTCTYGVCACIVNAYPIQRERCVWSKTCCLILFRSTLKVKQVKIDKNTSKMMNQFTTNARFINLSVYSINAKNKVSR